MGGCADPGRFRCERGQATVAFVAVIPTLVLITLALLQLALAGYAAIGAGTAARAAARADYVGGDAEQAALRALPPSLRDGTEVEVGGEAVEVEVEAPRSLPVGKPIPVTASTRLGPSDGVPGG